MHTLIRRLVFFLAWSVAGFFLYKSAGTLFGTFRTDELYYLQDAWAAYKDFSTLRGVPPHFNRLLEVYWRLTQGHVAYAWTWRCLMLLVVAAQAWVIYRMLVRVMPAWMRPWRHVAVSASAAFVLVMCAYRGYEIRPEAIPNTLILLAAYWIFFVGRDREGSAAGLILLALSGVALILAASISFRHTLPAGILLLFALYELIRSCRQKFMREVVFVVSGWLLLAGYLNFFSFDLLDGVQQARSWQHGREARTWLGRLEFGGGLWHLEAKATFLGCALFLAVLACLPGNKGGRRVAVMASFAALAAYYAFLFGFDGRPFEYVRSVEWLLLVVCICVVLQNMSWSSWCLNWLGGISVLLALASAGVLVDEAIDNVDYWRNSNVAIEALRDSVSSEGLTQATDRELVALATASPSVIDQMRARGVFCERFPDGKALVYSFGVHPICMRDAGSLALAGWEGSMNLDDVDFAGLKWLSLPPDAGDDVKSRLIYVPLENGVYVR